MNTLLKTRCNKGMLVAYENMIAVELKSLGVQKTNSMPYSRITGIEVNTKMAKIPFLSKGYADVKIFGQGNQTIEVGMVVLDDAKKIEEIVNARLN